MARETKVGLLAGLAFVICFSVILANRGGDSAAIPSRSVLSDAGSRVSTSLQQSASRSPSGAAQASPMLPDAPQRGASTGAELLFRDPAVASPNRDQPASPGQHPALSTALTERVLPSADRALSAAAMLQNPPLAPPLNKSAEPGQGAPAGSRPYTVLAGDTLSKIALTQFGTKSRKAVNALFEANRSVLENPDSVKPGLVLTLPGLAIEATPHPSEPAGAKAAPKAKPEDSQPAVSKKPAETSAAAARWYHVKKNDRWVSIAREQLGDSSRWKELHELNKDKFPDPQKIREGVRIKLPSPKSLASAEGRR